ncbi:hypothetical protein G7Y89_g6628 [Cudoniella acicularis]|uniref:Uncharacterized protein n=1 Tax=Cudoniella acicularis TaxID=354080 RepID=A0A8H4W2U0_9HELO|nr:hypothetical protein G7Y89_g6628 [Cudoniella acicularis]
MWEDDGRIREDYWGQFISVAMISPKVKENIEREKKRDQAYYYFNSLVNLSTCRLKIACWSCRHGQALAQRYAVLKGSSSTASQQLHSKSVCQRNSSYLNVTQRLPKLDSGPFSTDLSPASSIRAPKDPEEWQRLPLR